MILKSPSLETSNTADVHSLLADNTSLNKLALKEILSVNPFVVVSTGIFTRFVFVEAYPITTCVSSPAIRVNVSVSDKADLPLIKVSIK